MPSLRTLLVAAALGGLTGLAPAAGYSGLTILGDSLSDVGNVALVVGADPTQAITNTHVPNQPYALNQFSNADVWVKSFAASLGFAAAGQPSLSGGTDFAFGGARVATDGSGLPPSLQAQADSFLSASGGVAPAGALYVVQGGGNDARDLLVAAATSATPAAVIAAGAAAYAQQTGAVIDELQAAGARHIIVWDVPDLALAPAVTAQGPGATFLGGQVALAMNQVLKARLASESDVRLFDVFGLVDAFAANPSAYGFSNVTDACGALPACDPSTYLFWDGIHPTSAGHALLAQQMLLTAVPEPGAYALLLGGLAVVAWRGKRRGVGTSRSA